MTDAPPAASWSLRQRLAQVLVLTALLPVLLFGMALLWSQWQADRDSLMLRLDANARTTADAMDDFLRARLSAVVLAARQVSEGVPAEDALDGLVDAYPAMLHALHVDQAGRILAARGRDGAPAARNMPALGGQAWFRAARDGGVPVVSDVFRAWIYVDDALVSLSAPIVRDGVQEGALHVSIPVGRLAGAMSESLHRRGFDLLVLDRSNRVVHADRDLRWEQLQAPPNAAEIRELAHPSGEPGDIRVMDGLLREDGQAYVDAVAMRNGWMLVLVAPQQRLLRPLLSRLWMLAALLAVTTLGVLWALWRQRGLLRDSIGALLSGLRGHALGAQLGAAQMGDMPEELQPLASGIADLGNRMNAAFDELREVLDEREHVIAQRTESLREAVSELDLLSRTDALTGGLNYRGFREAGDALFRQARADGLPLSVLSLDIDHFKAYNDHYGHLEGDGALRRFAGAVRSALLHADDVLARPGGEEFIVFLPGTTLEQARAVARRDGARVRGADIQHAGSPAGRVTVSVGVAALEPGDAEVEDLLARADASMYRAKEGGRDRVGD